MNDDPIYTKAEALVKATMELERARETQRSCEQQLEVAEKRWDRARDEALKMPADTFVIVGEYVVRRVNNAMNVNKAIVKSPPANSDNISNQTLTVLKEAVN